MDLQKDTKVIEESLDDEIASLKEELMMLELNIADQKTTQNDLLTNLKM